MGGQKRMPVERAIIFAGAMAELEAEQVDRMLRAVAGRNVQPKSYEMCKTRYAPIFRMRLDMLAQCIYHPQPISALLKELAGTGGSTVDEDL